MSIAQYNFLYCPVRFLVLPSPVFSEICCLFRLVKSEILPVLPSWKLSGVGIVANKTLGPRPPAFEPRALLANIITQLNFQLGNTDTVCP